MASSVPTVGDLADVYALDVDAQRQRYARLARAFEDAYGAAPEFVARAPGRVNIIGEHIDYCGLPVFPMAIAPDTLVAVRANGTDRIRLANVDSAKYPARELCCSRDVFAIDSTVHEWSNYFLCGYRGMLEHAGRSSGEGLDVLVDGAVPAGSGLSSSAALVCATQLAVQRTNGLDLSQTELATVAAAAERYVGVNSGGMDQTASIMGRRGSALFIEFYPALMATPVALPETGTPYVFIVANSLVVADKHVTAPVCYNLRVVETRVGALLLAKHLGIANRPACRDVDPLTFKAVMDEYFAAQGDAGRVAGTVETWISRLEAMLDAAQQAFGAHAHGYTRQEMAAALGTTPDALSAQVHEGQFPVRAERFKLLQRAQHAFSEALRVVRFRQICESDSSNDAGTDSLAALGKLMDESQASCRDLFECSCAELDELCVLARRAGSLGSRLTGAGWGGCTVHLVPQDKAAGVRQTLEREYYGRRFPALSAAQLASVLFVTAPGSARARTSVPLDDGPAPAEVARTSELPPTAYDAVMPANMNYCAIKPVARCMLQSTASTSSAPMNGNVHSANNYYAPAAYDSSLSIERGGELPRGQMTYWMDRCNNRPDDDQPTSSDDATPVDDSLPDGSDHATPDNGGQPDGSRTTPEDDGPPSGSDDATPKDVGPPGDSRIPPNDRGRSSTSSAEHEDRHRRLLYPWYRHPTQHFRAFYELAKLFQSVDSRATPQNDEHVMPGKRDQMAPADDGQQAPTKHAEGAKGKRGRVFQAFPLRTSWVPAHTHIDIEILCTQILGCARPRNESSDEDKPSDEDRLSAACERVVETWGRVVHLNNRAFKPSSNAAPELKRHFWGSVDTDGVSLSIFKKTDKEKLRHRGRQKLAEGQVARSKQRQRTQRKRKAGSSKAPKPLPDIPYVHQVPHQQLLETTKKALLLDPGRGDILHGIFQSSDPNDPRNGERFRLTHRQEVVQRRMPRFKQIQLKVKRQFPGDAVQLAEDRLAQFSRHTLDKTAFNKYIAARSKEWRLLSDFYALTETVHAESHHQWHAKRAQYLADEAAGVPQSKRQQRKARQYLSHEPMNYPLHRRLRLSAYLNKQRFDAYLVSEIRRRFGADVAIGGELVPRSRCWNRDTAAALNFGHILRSLRSTGTVPDRFLRPAARERAVADRARAAASYISLVGAIGSVAAATGAMAAAAGGPGAATSAPAVMASDMDAACSALAAAAGALAAAAGAQPVAKRRCSAPHGPMLKAFTKVFHKSHDPPEEQPAARRVLERHRPAELGLGSAGQAARVPDARAQGAPRRVGAGSYAPLPPPMGAQPTKDAGQHTSLQYRMEQQQVLPRLHVKAPASGPDGGFPLTAENLEWHLRMLPPMKESKYDRILRYVRDQQQHVAAAAAGDPGQHDIEQSMLMSGGPIHHHDYADPRLAPMEHAAPQPGQFLVPAFGTAPVFVQQPHGGGMQPRMAADRGYTAAPGPAYPAAGAAAQKPVPPQANHVAVRPADAAAVAIRHTRDASADPHADNEEEDDNTPLAAISWAAPALQPAALQVAIPGAGLDGLYSLDDSLDGPLPSPVRLAMGDRISMMSFPSNMAVNFASEANEANSRTLSASLHEINNSLATPAPLTPTAHDAPVLRLSTHSGSSPHSMLAPLRAVDQPAPPADTDGCMAPPDAESAESAV
ncbi:galactokinase, partial [Coemansia spiralis]